MAVVTVRNLSAETHRALKVRAAANGRSTEAEIRLILDAAARPPERLKVGSSLARLAPVLGKIKYSPARDPSPSEPADFE